MSLDICDYIDINFYYYNDKNNNLHKSFCLDCQYKINNQINNIIALLDDYVYKILYERKVFI